MKGKPHQLDKEQAYLAKTLATIDTMRPVEWPGLISPRALSKLPTLSFAKGDVDNSVRPWVSSGEEAAPVAS